MFVNASHFVLPKFGRKLSLVGTVDQHSDSFFNLSLKHLLFMGNGERKKYIYIYISSDSTASSQFIESGISYCLFLES